MMFFEDIFDILNDGDINNKFTKFNILFDKFRAGQYETNISFEPKEISSPSYCKFCKIYKMKELKKDKNINKTVSLLHSIAHIEYSAIDIALDACYRFSKLPREFYFDWLEVASDEIRHFKLINEKLKNLGFKYGDFSVHDGLFVALQKTANNLVERMAILPRFMEANGLDANLFIIEKNKSNKDQIGLNDILKIIHKEEINHVKKGDKWFKFACDLYNIDPKEWIDIVLKQYPKAFNVKRQIDVKHRLLAGFTQDEIDEIINLQGRK